ncbi:MAG TPA: ABC transporter ATP-binding protein [Burkholderiales bacterium]|nr:ABC transporter ATP-binding protein [Burkholderiales bacterium]
MSAPPLLEVADLRTWLHTANGVVRAVDGISFTVQRGETFALVGESGCGKSMTALSLMRLLPDAGRIVGGRALLEGTDLLALPEAAMREVRGARLGIIFQEPGTSLNPVLTVGAQIEEVLQQHARLRGPAARRRALELLEQVGIPDAARRLDEYPFQMSGGMKQRAMIAMALACNPGLLIADEPTTALDVTIQAQVLEVLRRLQREAGMSLLLITHDLGVVAEMAHRVAVMYAGEIVECAPRERFFRAPAHPYSRKLFEALPGAAGRHRPLAVIPGSVPRMDESFVGCRFADRCDRVMEVCRREPPPAVDLGDGQVVLCHLHAEARHEARGESRQARGVNQVRGTRDEAGGEETSRLVPRASSLIDAPRTSSLLQVEDLKVHFPIRKGVFKRVVGHVRAVDGVALEIPSHKTLALVGESGCGKTTVGKGLLHLLPLTGGRVLFEGEDLASLSARRLRARRKDIQIIFQDPYASLNPRMRVMEIVEEGMAALGIGASEAERQRRVDRLLEQVGLAPDMKLRYPHEFSGGQRQRIAIARALAVEPKLIVCDEPTSALDVSVQAQILNLLKDLQTRLGLAYLFITHNISVVEFLAHEVAVMYLGRIVEKGTVEEVVGSPRHPYTQALLSAVPNIDAATKREVIRLQGELPSPSNPPAGCHFHPRCPRAMPDCRETYPGEVALSGTHSVRCLLYK